MGHTYCTVLCAGVKSGVRIHGTHWCRGRSVVRLVQCGKESAIWCGSPWYRVVLWLPGAASWGRLSGSYPKLHNTLTAEQCAALRYNTLATLHHCGAESRRQRAATVEGRGRSSPVLHRTFTEAVIRPRGPSPVS